MDLLTGTRDSVHRFAQFFNRSYESSEGFSGDKELRRSPRTTVVAAAAAAANPGGDICGRDQLSPQPVPSCLWPKQKPTAPPPSPTTLPTLPHGMRQVTGRRALHPWPPSSPSSPSSTGGTWAIKAGGYETQSPATRFHLQYLRCVGHTTQLPAVTEEKGVIQEKTVMKPRRQRLTLNWRPVPSHTAHQSRATAGHPVPRSAPCSALDFIQHDFCMSGSADEISAAS